MTDLKKEIELVTEQLLPSDPQAWCRQYAQKSKIIHDGLWGTLELQPHEVALVDTPLLQRLRFIRQTGAVHLTYPSAVHTRFEHTIGVLCQAGRMCQVLQARQSHIINQTVTNNIRIAAILHDTGHGPFSHTSEQYFSSFDDIAALKEGDTYKHSGAGEILSDLIVRSPAMTSFVKALNVQFEQAIDLDLVGRMITGQMPDDQMYLSEFVHGPFDADKLDYMHRDGMFTGLRMHVDLDRLFSSMAVTAGTVDGKTQRRLAGSIAGTSPLTQIMFNKMLLFTGIYHHHKVRSVDCMLWALFDRAKQTGGTLGGITISSTADFLRLTDDRVLIPELTNREEVREIIDAIRNRRLWQRALVISRRTVTPEMHEEARDNPRSLFSGLIILAGDDREHIMRRREIADMIWEAAGRPCKSHEVWLDIPLMPKMNEAKRMWIRAPGQENPGTLGDFIPIAEWVGLYGLHRWQAHVVCPSSVASRINVAAESVLKEMFGLQFNEFARSYAHVD